MTFINKIKWILAVLVVFIVILATNLIDQSNFQRVKDSAVSIYEDRLVAKGIILDLSNEVHSKEIATVLSDSVFFGNKNLSVNKKIDASILKFEKTKRTIKEDEIFDALKNNLTLLKEEETSFVKDNYLVRDKLLKQIVVVKGDLISLSAIQLEEGSKQMSISKKAIDVVELFTHLEIYILIFLAVLIQLIIIYSPKKNKTIE